MNRERKYACKLAWHFIGTFYSWGGDDPSGFDCSRFTGEIMKALDIIPRHKPAPTAREQWEMFQNKRVDRPSKGCLVFFGEPLVTHVEFCIDSKYSIGASEGGSRVKTREDAIKYNAFIKLRPIKRNRNIVGYVDPFWGG